MSPGDYYVKDCSQLFGWVELSINLLSFKTSDALLAKMNKLWTEKWGLIRIYELYLAGIFFCFIMSDGYDSPCGSSEKEHPADECLFFSRHVPTLVNNFYDNKKLQFFISDFSLPRVTQAAAKCTVLYYYLFL